MGNFLNIAGSWVLWVFPFIPLLVGLLTKLNASSKIKSIAMILFNGLAALAYQIDTSGGILTKETASAWAFGIIVSTATYLGIWKPLEVTQNLAPDKGIG
jgi:hypothetical protein